MKKLICILALGEALGACGKKGGKSGGGGLADGQTTYQFTNTPSSLAISLPDSLTAKSSSGTSLRLQGGADAPSASKSQGYAILTESVRRVQQQLGGLSMNNAVLDVVMSKNCTLDKAGDTCTASNACAPLTQQMLNSLKESLGEASFSDEGPLGGLDDKKDTEICLESVKVTRQADSETYAFKAEITLDDKNSFVQSWSEDKKKVNVVQSFEEDFSEMDGAPALMEGPTFKGTMGFTYNADTELFLATSAIAMSFGGETQNIKESFKFQKATQDAADEKVLLKATIEQDQNSFYIEGMADKNGGLARTSLSVTSYAVSSATLSDNCSLGAQYMIFPKETAEADVEGAEAFMKLVGSFGCQEPTTSPAPNSIQLMASVPDTASDLVLFTMEMPGMGSGPGSSGAGDAPGGFDPGAAPGGPGLSLQAEEDPFAIKLTKSSITFTQLSAALSVNEFCYEEEFDGKGELKAWKSAESKCGDSMVWVTTEGTVSQEYSVSEEEISKIETPKFKYKGISNSQSIEAFDFGIFSANTLSNKPLPNMKLIYTANEACRLLTSLDYLLTTAKDNCQAVEVGTMRPKSTNVWDGTSDFMSNYDITFTGTQEQTILAVYYEIMPGKYSRVVFNSDDERLYSLIMVKE